MRTDKQNEASRNNGGKSKGPVTPEGKAKSSGNATSHNLCVGHLVLLSNEDPRQFHHHMIDYVRRFQPIDGVEFDLVHKMIAASWREMRVTNMEAALFELEMDRQQPDVDDEFEDILPAARQVLALFGTNDTKAAAALLHRYGSTARRAFSSAFRILRELQGDRFNRPPAVQQPGETIPLNPHPKPPQPIETQTEIETETDAPSSHPASASFPTIVVVRRRSQPQIDPENTKLPNEPKHLLEVLHAFQSMEPMA